MWPLLKLLFNRDYWRALVNGRLWREAWIALRRAHKDRRSWRVLAQQLYRLLVPFLVLVWIASVATAQFAGAWLVLGFTIAWSRLAFGGKKGSQAEPSPVTTLGVGGTLQPYINAALRRELAEICLLHAVLADRAGSERVTVHKVLPEGFEVVTRRRHLGILREHGLLERLRAEERDLLLLPDGHWPPHAIRRAELGLEPLRSLRWVLGVDPFLPLAGGNETLDYRLASPLLDDPATLLAAPASVTAGNLARGREAGRQRFLRFWAEGLHRGILESDDEERRQWAAEVATRYQGKESTDILVGAEIVSKVSDDVVRVATMLSLRRWAVLEWIEHRMTAQVPAFDELRGFYLADEGSFSA